MKNAKRKQSGFAMMMVIILVAVGTVLGLSYLTSSTVKLAGTSNFISMTRAQYLAESGLQHGLWLLRRDPEAFADSVSNPLGPYHVDDTGDGYCFYAEPVVGGSGEYVLTSVATVDSLTRSVSMTVRFTSGYRNSVMAHNPLMYWRLGELGGTAADDTAGDNDGTYCNGVAMGQSGAIPHNSNKAANFDGTNDYVDLGKPVLSGNAMTLLTWFKADDWERYDANIVSKTNHTRSARYYWGLSTIRSGGKGRLRFRLKTNGRTSTVTAGRANSCEANEWVFAAAVYDGSRMYLYKDGVKVAQRRKTGSIDEGPNISAWIGGNSRRATARPWDGKIDEVVILDRALSAEEIEGLYKARLPAVDILSWDE